MSKKVTTIVLCTTITLLIIAISYALGIYTHWIFSVILILSCLLRILIKADKLKDGQSTK